MFINIVSVSNLLYVFICNVSSFFLFQCVFGVILPVETYLPDSLTVSF